jgi:hypothetical protein
VVQGVAGADGNTVAAENATALRNFLGKSFLIEGKGPRRANLNA